MNSPVMNLDEIKKCIPHRDPFLWLDEVIEINDKQIIARKYLDPDLPVFQGHYPNHPVFPGVLQCEMAMQAGAVFISKIAEIEEGTVPVATRLNNVQFRKMVGPGDTLEIIVELTEHLSNAFFLKAKILHEGKVTTRCEFACAAAKV